MNIEQEIRAQIEKNRDLKLEIGYINNHLSILEGLLRNERDDVQKQVNEAYHRGVEDGRTETWEAARKIALNPNENGLSVEELDRIFGCATLQQVFRRYSAQQTIEKLKAYEEKQKADDEIKVGDEVMLCRHKVPYIVTSCDGDDDTYILMTVNGGFIKAGKYNVRKTGRRFGIGKILEEMRT